MKKVAGIITPVSRQPKPLITQKKINQAVAKLAADIRRDYRGKQPLLIGILKGSFVFMADLIRVLDLPIEGDFVKLCALVDKPSQHKVPVTIDYLGFTVPDKFVVGYGIDWNEKFRHLRDICF